MVCKMIVLSVMAAVSVGMAAISGKVTDNASGTPIQGAMVKLEQGGQTATTGADGSFTINTGTGIGWTDHSARRDCPVVIEGGLLRVNVPAASVVEITEFDLRGKALTTTHRSLNAGANSIAIRRVGTGVNLYRVKIGRNEYVLKGTHVGGGFTVTGATFSAPSEKKTSTAGSKSFIPIDDIILAEKSGYVDYRVIVTNSDTGGIEIKMLASAGTVKDADGNVYQTIKIGTQVWMTENLHTTKYNDGTAIPPVSDDKEWAELTTPGYCFYENSKDSAANKHYGALYNWFAVDTKKLAPAGWHVPTDAEWTTLFDYLMANGFNWDNTTENKVAKAIAAKTDWDEYPEEGAPGNDVTLNNKSGFAALPAGVRFFEDGLCAEKGYFCFWWSATEDTDDTKFAMNRDMEAEFISFNRNKNVKITGLSVRLVKD